MDVIIVEDEPTAVKNLQNILSEISNDLHVIAVLPSVRETLGWLKNNPEPDVGFFDIQLADDVSFQIFDQSEITFPVIFTTAYDNYLLDSFEYHSVHYLLKPLQKQKVAKAISKVEEWKKIFTYQAIRELLKVQGQSMLIKDRFIVRKGNEFIPIETTSIAYFFTEHGLFFVMTFDQETFMIDQSLTEVEVHLDKRKFFRANRQHIVHVKAIAGFRSIEQSKIRLELSPVAGKEIIIGKQNSVQFRQWIANV